MSNKGAIAKMRGLSPGLEFAARSIFDGKRRDGFNDFALVFSEIEPFLFIRFAIRFS